MHNPELISVLVSLQPFYFHFISKNFDCKFSSIYPCLDMFGHQLCKVLHFFFADNLIYMSVVHFWLNIYTFQMVKLGKFELAHYIRYIKIIWKALFTQRLQPLMFIFHYQSIILLCINNSFIYLQSIYATQIILSKTIYMWYMY